MKKYMNSILLQKQTLKISADKELTQLKREIITIQSKNISADGQSHIVKTFSVVVNVNPKVSVGLQLLLSNDANFESYVVYKGEPLMGETKVETVYLSEIYNQLCDDPLFPLGTVFDWKTIE